MRETKYYGELGDRESTLLALGVSPDAIKLIQEYIYKAYNEGESSGYDDGYNSGYDAGYDNGRDAEVAEF